MITVETIDIDNEFSYTEKYKNIAEFIHLLGETGSEIDATPSIAWDPENGEGMFYIEGSEGTPLSMGLIEEKRNRVQTTVDDVLKAIG